ncbi:MAG: GH36 C-terminal domain-containing protein, partial [Lachnospiraceae bacterium]|nr:GH36 C-terminal domain-containing protein [Lachnospiraceae bacterium]
KFYKMDGETEEYTVSGALLNNAGIKLKQAFGGTGFDDETRLFKDFSSRMYFIESI